MQKHSTRSFSHVICLWILLMCSLVCVLSACGGSTATPQSTCKGGAIGIAVDQYKPDGNGTVTIQFAKNEQSYCTITLSAIRLKQEAESASLAATNTGGTVTVDTVVVAVTSATRLESAEWGASHDPLLGSVIIGFTAPTPNGVVITVSNQG